MLAESRRLAVAALSSRKWRVSESGALSACRHVRHCLPGVRALPGDGDARKAAVTMHNSTMAGRSGSGAAAATALLGDYELGLAYDEMVDRDGGPRPHYGPLHGRLLATSPDDFRRRKAMTDLSMQQDGVGFTVYRAEEGIERVWPMDPVPRIVPAPGSCFRAARFAASSSASTCRGGSTSTSVAPI
jgi:hypothetical protein